MGPLPDLDDRDLDRLLAGREVDGDSRADDLAGLVGEVRATHLRPVAQETRERHLAAMAEAARHAPSADPAPSVRTQRSPRRLKPRNRYASILAALGAIAVTAGVGGTGLAVAGVVDLPDPADAALEKVGVNLDAEDDAAQERAERAAAVREVIRSTPPSERNCAFGHRVAEAGGKTIPEQAEENCARQLARAQEREDAKAAKAEKDAGEQEETEAADDRKAAEKRDSLGAETSRRAREQRRASPQERRKFGQETAQRARQRARDRGASAGGNPDRPANPGPSVRAPRRQGRPDSAGPPAGATRPPDFAGPPEARGGGRPEGAGGRPEGAGPP